MQNFTIYIHTYIHTYIYTFHRSMTSPQGAFGYETLSVVKRMIIKISCHNTSHYIQRDKTQNLLT